MNHSNDEDKTCPQQADSPPTEAEASSLAASDDKRRLLQQQQQQTVTQHVILFYKYHPLSSDLDVMETYRCALERLSTALQLKGRILIGCSEHEGINGTLAGSHSNLLAFTQAMLRPSRDGSTGKKNKEQHDDDIRSDLEHNTPSKAQTGLAVQQFRLASQSFFKTLGVPELLLDSPHDFKWSTNTSSTSSSASPDGTSSSKRNDDTTNRAATTHSLFPDLQIKLVRELIGTGGVLANISIDETAQGYLTPKEWHERLVALQARNAKSSSNGKAKQSHTNSGTGSTDTDTTIDSSHEDDDTILIDCRNAKEFAIGHFTGALDPQTSTFGQFPKWVSDNKVLLEHKTVLMYCTGGIRCEKASAYIRRTVPSVKEVGHLKGGIHKYLEEFGDISAPNDGRIDSDDAGAAVWKGRNFVFDGRGAASGPETMSGAVESAAAGAASLVQPASDVKHGVRNDAKADTAASTAVLQVVGRCIECNVPFDSFDPHCVCTVCREPTLVCHSCRNKLVEYHCRNHRHLRSCYFTNLDLFTYVEDLQGQLGGLLTELDKIAVGKRFKAKRKTLQKQIERVQARIDELSASSDIVEVLEDKSSIQINTVSTMSVSCPNKCVKCRSCGDDQCVGNCWGFHGLKRKERLDQSINADDVGGGTSAQPKCSSTAAASVAPKVKRQHVSQPKNGRRDDFALEMRQLGLARPPSAFRDAVTGIRVPPTCTRILSSTTKAKWCGETVLTVVQREFADLAKTDVLKDVVSCGLLRLNNTPLSMMNVSKVQLKSSDTLVRITHWHEAPVIVPATIDVETVQLPVEVLREYGVDGRSVDDISGDGAIDGLVYVCNKPSSVPTHPAGPYLANSLTIMVESQEGLPVQSLNPIHRTDRVTSGLTLCCTSPAVSRAFHKSFADGTVDKLYLALVAGKFPASISDAAEAQTLRAPVEGIVGSSSWSDKNHVLSVDAPIYTLDASSGMRTVDAAGKPSRTRFQRVAYRECEDTSLVACYPITGRNHQIRVHLQWLGFPIVNDVQYGGRQRPDQMKMSESAVQAMINAMAASDTLDEKRVVTLTPDDGRAARRACPCCRDDGNGDAASAEGIRQSFSAAQLLREGHAIYLHALRYRVRFLPKTNINNTASSPAAESNLLAELSFRVKPPDWAHESDLHALDWL